MTERELADGVIEPFAPDWASPPGETILDLVFERLGRELGLTMKCIEELVCGDLEIDEALARRLAAAFDTRIEFWLEREAQYREDLRRRGRAGERHG